MAGEQKQFEYGQDGWPTQHNHEAVKHTPEEKLLSEAIDILTDVLMDPTEAKPHQLPTITRVALDRVRNLITPVFDVVSDYSHMKARIDELEHEVDDRDEKISDLEEKLANGDDDPDGDDDEEPTTKPS